MSELQNKLNSLLQQINDKKYEGVTWADGQNPPLSAEHLNKSENALRELLTVFNSSSEGGIIQQIIALLIAESEQREQHNEDTDKSLDVLTNQDNSFKTSLSDTNKNVTTNTTNINANVTKINSLNTDVSNLNKDVSNLKGDVEVLQTNVANNTTNIESLQQDLDNIQENVEGLIGDKVVQDGDEVVLRCGTSTTVLFDVSE